MSLNGRKYRRNEDDSETGNKKKQARRLIAGILVLAICIIAITIIIDTLEIIPAGYKGVVINSPSGPSSKEINEGYQFSLSYIWADVEKVEYRTQTLNFVGYDNQNDHVGSVQVITNDSVPIFVDFSIVYHIQEDKVSDLIIGNGLDYADRIIAPYARSIVRDTVSNYQALDVIGERRGEIENAISTAITEQMSEKYIVVEGVAMRDVRIPSSLQNAIVEKKNAQQNVLTQQYNLQAQEYIANQTIVNARANAQSVIIEAQGQSEAIQIVMEALNTTDMNDTTKNYLSYLYIRAMSDPNTNIRFIIVPSDGGLPILINTTDEE